MCFCHELSSLKLKKVGINNYKLDIRCCSDAYITSLPYCKGLNNQNNAVISLLMLGIQLNALQ